jgi:hypothetical protein
MNRYKEIEFETDGGENGGRGTGKTTGKRTGKRTGKTTPYPLQRRGILPSDGKSCKDDTLLTVHGAMGHGAMGQAPLLVSTLSNIYTDATTLSNIYTATTLSNIYTDATNNGACPIATAATGRKGDVARYIPATATGRKDAGRKGKREGYHYTGCNNNTNNYTNKINR